MFDSYQFYFFESRHISLAVLRIFAGDGFLGFFREGDEGEGVVGGDGIIGKIVLSQYLFEIVSEFPELGTDPRSLVEEFQPDCPFLLMPAAFPCDLVESPLRCVLDFVVFVGNGQDLSPENGVQAPVIETDLDGDPGFFNPLFVWVEDRISLDEMEGPGEDLSVRNEVGFDRGRMEAGETLTEEGIAVSSEGSMRGAKVIHDVESDNGTNGEFFVQGP